MYLIEQHRDGKRSLAELGISGFQLAFRCAHSRLARNPEIVALYLYTKTGDEVLRTYYRHRAVPPYTPVQVRFGYYPWPEPPTIYPGRLPSLAEHMAHDLAARPAPALETCQEIAIPLAVQPKTEPRLAGYGLSDIHRMRTDNLALAEDKRNLTRELAEAKQAYSAMVEKWERDLARYERRQAAAICALESDPA